MRKSKKVAIRKTYYYYYYVLRKVHLNRKRLRIIKKLTTKIVADWALKVVVSRTEPIRIAFDWRE